MCWHLELHVSSTEFYKTEKRNTVHVHVYARFGAVALSAAWSHSGLPRSAPVLSPCLGGRKVLMAAAIPDSLSICCWWHASFTVTSPSLTMVAEVPCFFQFLPPNLHLMDAIFHPMVVNDLCCLRCDSLHSNWSQLNYGIVLQLNDSTWIFLWSDIMVIIYTFSDIWGGAIYKYKK